jgi:hypothetical protein
VSIIALETTTTTTTTSSSSSSSPEQAIPSSPFPTPLLPNSTSNGFGLVTSSTPSMGNSDDDITVSPCARSKAAREYAFVDCSEVYLAGKRTSGIYEIW